MKKILIKAHCILIFVTLLAFTISSTALADKPSWAGNKGKSGKHEQKIKKNKKSKKGDDYSQDRQLSGGKVGVHFDDHQRNVVHTYYKGKYRSGKCPPGLAKKNNGCMPPGQAKKWQIGRQLPSDVIFHDLSPEIIIELGAPPVGHRFIRVAADILLIATGTGMVLDAIQDLSEL